MTNKCGRPLCRLLAATLLGLATVQAGVAEVPVEPVGRVAVLDRAFDPHWLWAADASAARLVLLDLDDGRFLGQINTGWGMPQLLVGRVRPEIYVPETYFSRGTRGVRTDLASVYDARTLAPVAEVLLPPKRAINPLPVGNTALSDDDRFLAVFNMTPATSLTLVDLQARQARGEIPTPGCSLVYAIGARRFAALCADGALLVLEIDGSGQLVRRVRTEPFFDPVSDPVMEKAVRWGDRWVFVSFEGLVHAVDFSSPQPRFASPWSLLGPEDREQGWRPGGTQPLAIHSASGRLYVLVHQGGVDTHKEPGSEIWVYDLRERRRVKRIEAANPGLTIMGSPVLLGTEWTNAFLLDHVAPTLGIEEIAVTQDDEPLLVTGASYTGSLCVHDARTGALLRRLATHNMTNQLLFAAPRQGPVPAASGSDPAGGGEARRGRRR